MNDSSKIGHGRKDRTPEEQEAYENALRKTLPPIVGAGIPGWLYGGPGIILTVFLASFIGLHQTYDNELENIHSKKDLEDLKEETKSLKEEIDKLRDSITTRATLGVISAGVGILVIGSFFQQATVAAFTPFTWGLTVALIITRLYKTLSRR